ncbi:MAG TPA: hypothetical protein VGP63_20805 [Planctomycetaceae bacterium]|jgi:hypothetical protein|nr:hypothetical protein [Planctomycetaceae bacterium]
MRFVRKFAFRLAILSLAAMPLVGVGCTDQGPAKPAAGEHTTEITNKVETKTSAPKPPKKKRADDAGSTTGDLGVKPPKVPADKSKG